METTSIITQYYAQLKCCTIRPRIQFDRISNTLHDIKGVVEQYPDMVSIELYYFIIDVDPFPITNIELVELHQCYISRDVSFKEWSTTRMSIGIVDIDGSHVYLILPTNLIELEVYVEESSYMLQDYNVTIKELPPSLKKLYISVKCRVVEPVHLPELRDLTICASNFDLLYPSTSTVLLKEFKMYRRSGWNEQKRKRELFDTKRLPQYTRIYHDVLSEHEWIQLLCVDAMCLPEDCISRTPHVFGYSNPKLVERAQQYIRVYRETVAFLSTDSEFLEQGTDVFRFAVAPWLS